MLSYKDNIFGATMDSHIKVIFLSFTLLVSQTTTISTTTGGQDMTSTAYTTTSINEQTTRSEAYTTSGMICIALRNL